jgi:hypothetical protein
MAQKQWVRDPDRGGTKIPETVRHRTEARLRRFAEDRFAGRYTRLDVRFRGQFCYVDAYTEPEALGPDWPPADWPESREEYQDRLHSTPTHLCRLRYFGDEERWGFGFYSYASERYELSMFPTGEFYGRPEDALEVSAEMYLR